MKKFILLTLFTCAILISTNNNTFSKLNSSDDPTDTVAKEVCIVSGETIEGGGVKYVYLNKEILLCCEGCEKSFKKNPAKFLGSAGLMCPVCNEDDANAELSTTSGGVKYYFCGKGCKSKFIKDPDEFLNKYKK